MNLVMAKPAGGVHEDRGENKVVNQREAVSSNIFAEDFNPQSLGIGGLGAEFADISRRVLLSRLVVPSHMFSKLRIKHVKGLLLYGPPGTGKTLMAVQIAKLLNGKEPKIVKGPEILSDIVGQTEKNIRDLFADAEHDQRILGDQSETHAIIFDEIDAICKVQGSTRETTCDRIVKQLAAKLDGMEPLNNILLIGITRRKDLVDKALIRPGLLEVEVQFSLPDEKGRLQILQIHTEKIENTFLASDVNLQELAARTKNYSGAELEAVVKTAVSCALNRPSSDDVPTTKTVVVDREGRVGVGMEDLLRALHDVVPAFGGSTDELQ